MIPCVAILGRPEFISKHISLSNRALCDAVDTVHVVCVQLADAVPVDSRAILVIIVSHMNDKLVTPTSLNERSRKLFIKDLTAGLLKSIC